MRQHQPVWMAASAEEALKDGGWNDVDAEEMYRFLDLIIFMGIVKVSSLHKILVDIFFISWSLGSSLHVSR